MLAYLKGKWYRGEIAQHDEVLGARCQMGAGCWVLGNGGWGSPGVRCWVSGARWVLGSGDGGWGKPRCEVLGVRCQMGAGFWGLRAGENPGVRCQVPGKNARTQSQILPWLLTPGTRHLTPCHVFTAYKHPK